MQLRSESFQHDRAIPARLAFGKAAAPVALSDNRSPHLAWKDAPAGTGRPTWFTSSPRVEFVHWLLANIPAECGELAEGACSDEVTPRGKREPFGPPGSVQGLNDYTGWFAGDAAMAGQYLGYDGPCPPWNDALLHHYHFSVSALDVPALKLAPGFTLAELRAAMAGHVLAEASLVGTYTLNSALA